MFMLPCILEPVGLKINFKESKWKYSKCYSEKKRADETFFATPFYLLITLFCSVRNWPKKTVCRLLNVYESNNLQVIDKRIHRYLNRDHLKASTVTDQDHET